jgi:hypothetical protein
MVGVPPVVALYVTYAVAGPRPGFGVYLGMYALLAAVGGTLARGALSLGGRGGLTRDVPANRRRPAHLRGDCEDAAPVPLTPLDRILAAVVVMVTGAVVVWFLIGAHPGPVTPV